MLLGSIFVIVWFDGVENMKFLRFSSRFRYIFVVNFGTGVVKGLIRVFCEIFFGGIRFNL